MTCGYDQDHGRHVEGCTCGEPACASRASSSTHAFLRVSTHGEATVASFRFGGHCSAVELEEEARSVLCSMGEIVEGCGGVIGHIKAFVHDEGGGVKLSLTDVETGVAAEWVPPSECVVEGAAIVFGLDAVQLERDLSVIPLFGGLE